MNRQPTHPGAIIREDILPELDMSISRLAKELHISRQTLHGVISEKKSITPNLALRIGKFIGNGPDVWLRMQEAHDLYNEEKKIAPILRKIEQHHSDAAS